MKSNSNLAMQLKEYLSTEGGRIEAMDFFNKQSNEEISHTSFFESKSFFDILSLLKKWMISNNVYFLRDEDFSYNSYGGKNFPVSELDFMSVVSSISTSLNHLTIIESTTPFSNGYIDYGEWRLKWIQGQGYITTLELHRDRMRNDIIDKLIKDV